MMDALMREIERGTLAPVYLLYGRETFLMEEICDAIQERVLEGGDPSFNKVVVDLDEVAVQQLVREAESPPFFGGRRIVIGRNARFLSTAKAKQKVDHRLEELLRYADEPLSTTVLVLLVPEEKLDNRKKAVKKLERTVRTVRCDPLEGRELEKWVFDRFRRHGANPQPEAVRRLIRQVGSDLRLLHNECAKLALYAGDGGTVSAEDVDRLVPRTLEEDIFKLVDRAASRKVEEAFSILYDLLNQREEPIRILALMIRQFRILLQVKLLAAQGKSDREIASLLGLHPYPVKLARRQGKAYSERQLRRLLLSAIETDQAIKSGKIDKTFALERFLFLLGRDQAEGAGRMR
ncbi:DNA polymerase III, delta subunit [Planifilum fulgidum]|uniref:DNA polymerase III subunit delta n=1 Tax=Planifilum fulgidum TaxID=201973 RepID=A0A1I2KQM8_9BACL|nr:DNA polymerase III subunit delta [Planifilum fulgidum]SFF68629.1 DNA polymerase III, delta subunit [Planifilum fulgidum]